VLLFVDNLEPISAQNHFLKEVRMSRVTRVRDRINFFLAGGVIMGFYTIIRDRTEKTPVTAEQAQASTTDPEQEFFTFAEKLSQDETQKQKYLDVMEKLSRLVNAEAKKNPEGMSSYIEEIIPLIAKAGPGAALQAEEYASEAVREEMKRLKEDSNTVKLLEKEKQIAELEEKNKKILELATYHKEEFEKFNQGKEKYLVALITENSYINVRFQCIENTSKKKYEFQCKTIRCRIPLEIELPLGNYSVTLFEYGNYKRATAELSVTHEESAKYLDKPYHGIINF